MHILIFAAKCVSVKKKEVKLALKINFHDSFFTFTVNKNKTKKKHQKPEKPLRYHQNDLAIFLSSRKKRGGKNKTNGVSNVSQVQYCTFKAAFYSSYLAVCPKKGYVKKKYTYGVTEANKLRINKIQVRDKTAHLQFIA